MGAYECLSCYYYYIRRLCIAINAMWPRSIVCDKAVTIYGFTMASLSLLGFIVSNDVPPKLCLLSEMNNDMG